MRTSRPLFIINIFNQYNIISYIKKRIEFELLSISEHQDVKYRMETTPAILAFCCLHSKVSTINLD